MELEDLPEEVIIIILQKLDTVSIYNMYKSSRHIRNIICMPGVVKKFEMSKNVIATGNTFKSFFFKDVAANILELNMCAVPDLKRTLLLPIMKKLKKLKILDVSYTNINLFDFVEIFQMCPTLRNTTINFVFGNNGLIPVSNNSIAQFQNIFQVFENVHFIGSTTNLIHSKLPQYLLSKAKLSTLKYTVAECDFEYTVCYAQQPQIDSFVIQCKRFNVWILNWKELSASLENVRTFPFLSNLHLKMHELIVINMLSITEYSVYASQMFQPFFSESFDVQAGSIMEFQRPYFGNVAIMMWKKDCTNFDDVFFSNLYDELKQYLPSYCASASNKASERHDWFYIIPKEPNCDGNRLKMYGPEFKKKKRIAPQNFTLNYDTLFEEKQRVQLSILFQEHLRNPITLQPNSDYLKKLTFLSLSGLMHFSSDFFNILFRSCNNLITLNVEAPAMSPCASQISRSLPLTHSLKNLRLVDKRIDFTTLFSSLSQCVTLENIHIVEDSYTDHCDIADPSIILQCDNLYSCYIEAPISKSVRKKKMQMFDKAKLQLKKYYVNVMILVKIRPGILRYVYDPYVHVFNLNPIKPI